eukprot:TRINITY_DN333_c0_g1_i1.p1 TRINITY_DN333_c0_g1~~TRINITY_DN333_c0_g1_i1.p1  ORF type:complete len:152 (-),score=32.96 TRINITY_DN333_c0_g1_i1:267-722(-)
MSDLIWALTKDTSSFKRGSKHDTITLSAEPGNLVHRHSYKFSSVAQPGFVNVAPIAKSKKAKHGVVVISRNSKAKSNRVSVNVQKVVSNPVRSQAKIASICKAAGRPDLIRLAQTKFLKVHRGSYKKSLPVPVKLRMKRHQKKEQKKTASQ